MKKTLFIITALLSCSIAFAQEGEIIYTDFEPYIAVDYMMSENLPNPDINLDLDRDGIDEFKFYAEYMGWGHWIGAFLDCLSSQWSFRLPYVIFDPNWEWPIEGDTIQMGNTIANIENCWYNLYRFFYNPIALPNEQSFWIGSPEDHYYISVRNQTDDGYCYGWIDVNMRVLAGPYGAYHFYLTVFRMAYCTIPNYPLCVGQTDFTLDVDENESKAFAFIYPNPTTGMVTIMGKDLKTAEVFNALGQHLATAKGEGEQLTVDISDLPAGVYFVNVTDGEGRKCVKKVVKE